MCCRASLVIGCPLDSRCRCCRWVDDGKHYFRGALLWSGRSPRFPCLVGLYVGEGTARVSRVSAAAARCLSGLNGAAAAPVRVDVVSKRTRWQSIFRLVAVVAPRLCVAIVVDDAELRRDDLAAPSSALGCTPVLRYHREVLDRARSEAATQVLKIPLLLAPKASPCQSPNTRVVLNRVAEQTNCHIP